MSLKNIASRVSKLTGLNNETTKEVVAHVFDVIIEQLIENHRLEVKGFGTFRLDERKACNYRSYKTKELYTVPAKLQMRFKPSPTIKNRINP